MKTILWSILVLCSTYCFAQTQSTGKDTLVWNDGTVYTGTLIKQGEKTVRFKKEDGESYTIMMESIARLRLANTDADIKLPPKEKKETKEDLEKPQKKTESASTYQSFDGETPIDWSDPSIPKKILRKHRTGVGLTVVGTSFMVGGIAMIAAGAAANGQTTTVTNGYSVQTNANIGAVGVVGVLTVIAGLPMMIVGAVKVAKSKKLARARMIRLNKE